MNLVCGPYNLSSASAVGDHVISCAEVFQLTCGVSVILLIHADILIFEQVGSSSTSKSRQSPYDHEGVGVAENQTNK